jgi:hypothetical protein
MKKNVAIKWAKALESGRYKQGKGRLKTQDGRYCCLGVLCRVQGLTFRKDPADGRPAIYTGRGAPDSRPYETGVLPGRVIKSAGLCVGNTHGEFKDEEGNCMLAWESDDGQTAIDLVGMNDRGADFPTIAAVIRKNYKYL